MKASFSMSSLRDGISQEPEEGGGGGTPATLPRRKNLEVNPRYCIEKTQSQTQKRDEFWEALQPSYDYLMDDGLIASCKEANGELSWDELTDVWSYDEFQARYDELWSWGEELESRVSKLEAGVEPDEMKQFASKILALNEQSQRVERARPSCAEEVVKRTSALNRLWDTLQHCVAPEDSHHEITALKREIACQMRWLRKWIRGMEVQLGPIYRKSDWSTKDIETKLSHHLVVQKEIESREKNVLGVCKLCQRFEDLKESLSERPPPSATASTTPQVSSRDGGHWIRRDFEHLKKRFHALWLHSLEWQCWLEELLVSGPQLWGSLREDASSSSSSDEPNRKIPRLSSEALKAAAAAASGGAATAASAASTSGGRDMVGMAGPVRPTDHHDVGYSSESSAHLSNEDGAGEFVRVYTYTSAEATSPRVLEVVMDGDHRPRKTTPPRGDDDGDDLAKDEHDQTAVVMQAGPNCGTFYFCHEDSDIERPCQRQRMNGRKRLNFGSQSRSEDDEDDEEEDDDDDDYVNFSEVEEGEEVGQWPDGIHKLVDEAEELVKCSTVPREHVATVDSSCDASGEYTSSSSNDSDMESCSDRRGSVIHLKDSMASVVVSDCGAQASAAGVKLRSKKRRNGCERPSSVVEASQLSFNLKYAPLFNSETALNRMRKGTSSVVDPSRPKRSPRRCCQRKRLEVEGKCRSLGSLRHSSSSDNGRWRSVGSTIFSKSFEEPSESSCCGGPQDEAEEEEEDSSDEVDGGSGGGCGGRDNDADLTLMVHVPDNVSSASEQAWDDYQEAPYLSEAYSEQGVDDEAVRKLVDFGDDYQMYMGLPSSDGASTPSFYSQRPAAATHKWPLNKCGFDSESDIEEVNDLLAQHTKMLNATQLQLQRMAGGECPKAHLEDVLASVQIHIKCLRAVLEQLRIARNLSGPGHENRDRLMLEWERLVMQATEQEERLAQLGQLQNEAKELELSLSTAMAEVQLWSNKVIEQEDVVDEAKLEIQKRLLALEQLNPTLINLNFKIHNYVTRWNLDVVVLKKHVHSLYRSWDQVRETIEKKLSWLELVGTAWNDYKVERNCMQSILTEDRCVLNQLTQTIKCSPDLLTVARSSKKFMTSMNQVSMMKERLLKTSSHVASASNSRSTLATMSRTAERLQEVLGDECRGELSSRVSEQVIEASREIEAQEVECKQLLGQLTAMWEEQDVFKQLNLNRSSEEVVVGHGSSASRDEVVVVPGVSVKKCVKRKGESLMWRVVRAALPIQLAVVILFCFACLFEPHCCDTLNNFNLSLSPQLRYLDGPPPV